MFCQSCGQQVLDEYLYCFQRGTKLDTAIPSVRLLLSAENVTEKEAIEAYFYSGFSYRVILLFLDKYHDMPMSMSTLKRRLCEYNLKRNKVDINLPPVEKLIRDEMDGPGGICGYRAVWHMLRRNHGLFVPRQEVDSLIRTIDPAGVEEISGSQDLGLWW